MVKFEEMPKLEELEADLKAVTCHIDKIDKKCQITGKVPLSDQLHIIAEAIETEWKHQNIWILISSKIGSSFNQWTDKFVHLGIITKEDVKNSKDVYELAEIMGKKWVESGMVLQCKKQKIGRSTKPSWFPI